MKYRIKFDAVLALTYIDYKKGLGKNADKRYEDAKDILGSWQRSIWFNHNVI